MNPLIEIVQEAKKEQHIQSIGHMCAAISTFAPEKAKVVSLEFQIVAAHAGSKEESDAMSEMVIEAVKGLNEKIKEFDPNIYFTCEGETIGLHTAFKNDEDRQKFIEKHADQIEATKAMLEGKDGSADPQAAG